MAKDARTMILGVLDNLLYERNEALGKVIELEAKLAALDWTPITEGYTVPGEWESKCVLITHESSVKIGFQTTSYDWCVDGRVLKVRPTAWKPLPEPFVAMEGK